MTADGKIRARERDAILQSLRAGVVPASGHHHIQVGRSGEVAAVVKDIERISDGGASIRFVIGSFGSGKTFFLYLARSIALDRRLVTVHADLAPDRRLQGTGGVARSLYCELAANMATRARPDGGALAAVLERFIGSAVAHGRDHGVAVEGVLRQRLESLSELPHGFDFANVVSAYWRGHDRGDDDLKASALRWLRGEYATRTDARAALGVRTIVDDATVYPTLKLLARLVRLAGYGGLLVCLDEMVNLYRLANTRSRLGNYEQVLSILNDCLQGTAVGCGFLLGGTPEFLMDERKGLYSYPALQSRLAENPYAKDGLVDYSGPILRLASLTPEDVYILLQKLRHVHASGDPARYAVGDGGIKAFMAHCDRRIGDAYFRTPRNTIKEFLSLLAVVEHNPSTAWEALLGQVGIEQETDTDSLSFEVEDTPRGAQEVATALGTPEEDTDAALAKFRL